MNRNIAENETVIAFGQFTLVPARRLLEKNGVAVAIGSRALDILIVLAERYGEVVSKEELLSRVWSGINVEESCLRVHIAGLRKSIGEAQFIKNVPGRGYCFTVAVHRLALERSSLRAERSYGGSAPPRRLYGMIGADAALGMQSLRRPRRPRWGGR